MKISFINYRKSFPTMVGGFNKWFQIKRFWSGRIININVKHYAISLDLRKNWIADMISK